MKANLSFDIPEEKADFLRCVKADAAWNALFDIDRELRNYLKHGNQNDHFKSVEGLAHYIRRQINETTETLENP
ncbi:MAG: hypothetical protein ACO3EE_09090 [Flavobacteriales bacterium]